MESWSIILRKYVIFLRQRIFQPPYMKIIYNSIQGRIHQKRWGNIFFTKSLFHTWYSTKLWDRYSKAHSSDNHVNLFTKDCQYHYLRTCDIRLECIISEISSNVFIRGEKYVLYSFPSPWFFRKWVFLKRFLTWQHSSVLKDMCTLFSSLRFFPTMFFLVRFLTRHEAYYI